MTDWPRTMPALVTATDAGGDLDLDGHRHNVATVVERGARGMVLGGSTGQGPYLDAGERSLLVSAAHDVAPDAFVVCGVFAESVRQARAQVAESTEAGADAVLVATPGTLVRNRPSAILDFYRTLADDGATPILLYTVPQVTGVELTTDAVAELAELPSIQGVKDSGGQAERFGDWRGLTEAGFATYVGASRALLDAHRHGVHGAITASANYALADASLAVRGDAEAQRRLSAITTVVESHGVSGTMVAAAVAGLTTGRPRMPLPTLDAAAVAEITEVLTRHGLASAQPRRDR